MGRNKQTMDIEEKFREKMQNFHERMPMIDMKEH
jgi:hypothetical protein